ncbi:AAA family ATPase [Pseudomaricurvus alkylphenolicus]|uniref:ExeA family protein n=1 Tax=Pseudomaricurvus alkylphenolicus TaxID=1306991 RepID=UPI001421EBE8|nr:AAA family ATPase [Pseudomaricurvus alkylphenolicus]NIB41424.1 AAA family ATPase [Pseudomaricurvus alkylphenolicus]
MAKIKKSIYCDYFGFSRDPFSISPDPALLYPTLQHKKALAYLKYGLDREGGFILLTGEVGTGKTTLTRLMLDQLPGNIRVAYILNANADSDSVLRSVCKELGVGSDDTATDIQSANADGLMELLYSDLLKAHGENKKTLVVIEEAQNLDPEVLETLRLLTNLETNTTKLLHILLVGQPELLDTLAIKSLRQLNQRVVSRHHLQPLQISDLENYLNYRIQKVGGQPTLFSKSSLKTLFQHSEGIPRLVNLISERALLGVFSNGGKQVTPGIVKAAAEEVLGQKPEPTNAWLKTVLIGTAATALVAVLGAGAYFYGLSQTTPESTPVALKQMTTPDLTPKPTPGPSSSPVTMVDAVGPEATQTGLVSANAAPQYMAISPMVSSASLLAKLWGHEIPVTSPRELCQAAGALGLRCESFSQMALNDLFQFDRPGLVTLSSDYDQLTVYLLAKIEGDSAQLVSAKGNSLISLKELERRWQGDFTLLWQPPPGYRQPLKEGDSNLAIMRWLTDQMQHWQITEERLITGRMYTGALVKLVQQFQQSSGLEADGILGVRTIIRMNSAGGDNPKLLSANSDGEV